MSRENTIWNYPKSSCTCWNCEKSIYPNNMGKPSNISMRNCCVNSDYFNCHNTMPFGQNIEPKNNKNKTNMNPQSLTNKYATDFSITSCTLPKYQGSCPKEQYTSLDPRLVSAGHMGQRQTLDIPPVDPKVKMDTLLVDNNLDNYGQNYKNYEDIKEGNILYYIDHTIEDAYFRPNFTIPSNINAFVYKDPMGSFKPQYNRKPVSCRNVLDSKSNHYEGGLSWMADSLEQREDIMSLQMSKRNQQRYEPRYKNYN